jgi:hypothetical protein
MPGKARTVVDGAVADATEHDGILSDALVLFGICAIVVVIQFRTPFKVVGSVVAWVLILVVHLRQIVGIGDERKRDEPVDRHALSLSTERKMDRWIDDASMHRLYNLEARSIASRKDTGHAPKVADFV